MTMPATLPRPTDAELEILRVLWERGEATVREVHEAISRGRSSGYTTILKMLQIMTDKRLVLRDESERAHVYRPGVARQETERQLVRDLLDRAFGGSASRLVMQALSSRTASAEEIEEIRRLLDSVAGAAK